MQMNRLFEIVYILLKQKHITAQELSGRFGVSRRTIYRDVEALSLAGIPIYTIKGKGGGIGLLPQYTIERSLVSEHEQLEILSALQAMGAVTPGRTDQALGKLSALFNRQAFPWISVDFSDWSDEHIDLFESLKSAIIHRRIAVFTYYSSTGEQTKRRIEPVQLCFKHTSWYVRGLCLTRGEMRLFKISRIEQFTLTEDHFSEHHHTGGETPGKADHLSDTTQITLKLVVDASMRFRIYDEFTPSQIHPMDDGRFMLTVSWPLSEWVYGYILSFGEHIEVLEPASIRSTMLKRLEKTIKNFS